MPNPVICKVLLISVLFFIHNPLFAEVTNNDAFDKNPEANQDAQSERRFQAFPVILRIEGIGEIYGAAAGLKDVGKRGADIHVGASGGDVEAAVFSISDVQLKRSRLNYQFVNLNEATIQTQYARSTKTGPLFQQSLSGSAHHLGFEREGRREHLSSQFDLVLSNIVFEGFRDAQREQVMINRDGLHDVTSTLFRLAVNYDSREQSYFSAGRQLGNALSFTTGRKGQSDQGQWDFNFSEHLFVNDNLLLSGYFKASHAFIISEATAYDSDAEIRAELDAQCSSLPASQQAACSELENALIAYVLASNKYGTASAVGGGFGLRSYGEQFFRGANAWLQGVELDYRLPATKWQKAKRSLHFIVFAESAQVNDKPSDLFDDSLHSVGMGLRMYAGELALRLESAHGEGGNAWNFRVGMPY